MNLTPEERRKIYEEEKARIEREQAQLIQAEPPTATPYKPPSPWYKFDLHDRNLIGKILSLATIAITITFLLWFYYSTKTNYSSSASYPSTTSYSTPSSSPAGIPPITNENTAADRLYNAKLYLHGSTVTEYDLAEAKKRLELIPKSAPEYKEAQRLLTQIKNWPRNTLSPSSSVANAKNTATPAPSTVDLESQRDDVVYARIKDKARRDFPDDYVTQKFVYEEQIKAYQYMKTLPPSRIKDKAQRDFPDDYVTQKFVYEEQVKAQKAMQ